MKVIQGIWRRGSGWVWPGEEPPEAQLVLVFADHDHFQAPACFDELRARFPHAHIMGCSSSGNVMGTRLSDDSLVATAVRFDRARVELAVVDLADFPDAGAAARNLLLQLKSEGLRHVLVLSDGEKVNGSDLAMGFWNQGVTVSGGLAGDGTRFGTTWVMADAPARSGRIAALGLYGDVSVRSGCYAGWQEFGAERLVTSSVNNTVYEIDAQPALALYKKYLGPLAEALPGSGLRFPLSVKLTPEGEPLIRTLLGVDEATQSLRFAGDVPQGCRCRLMRCQLDDLIDSAQSAAKAAASGPATVSGLGLIVSCVGRRLVLGQLTEEELEVVQSTLGPGFTLTGFYSYGELAPYGSVLQCQLHNQTMTLTTLFE